MRILVPLTGVVLSLMVIGCAVGAGDGKPGESSEVSAPRSAPITHAYGTGASQFGELYLPEATGADAAAAVVVLIHGGFWSATYGLDLMRPLALDLVVRGYAVWNIEYRRVGEDGGGYPGTLDDVGLAIDDLATLADQYSLDLSRVALVGHSAGGHLALWAAGRPTQVVAASLAIGLGPVVDLAGGARDGLGGGAVVALLGGTPDEQPERYQSATPTLDGATRLVVVRGSADSIVPAQYSLPPEGSANIEVIDIEGDDHFDLIDPTSPSWAAVIGELPAP
jgi:acetyl esterase/lipase